VTLQIDDPYAVPGEFRKAQLHCHTTNSDGAFSPEKLLRMYRDAGYSFVCITDHNRVTRYEELNGRDFVAIHGTEDTVSRFLPPLGPHMGRLFVDAPLRDGSAQRRIDQTVAGGGIVSLCHPSWTGNLWTGAWSREAIDHLSGFHLVEIWNPHSNSDEDVRRWDTALRHAGPEQPVWGVAVDDCHRQDQFNRGWIMVKVSEVSATGLRNALLHGSFYASTGPSVDFGVDGGTVHVKVSSPGRIRFVDAGGRTRLEVQGGSGRYQAEGKEGYIRAECVTDGGRAWSQPFWVTGVQ